MPHLAGRVGPESHGAAAGVEVRNVARHQRPAGEVRHQRRGTGDHGLAARGVQHLAGTEQHQARPNIHNSKPAVKVQRLSPPQFPGLPRRSPRRRRAAGRVIRRQTSADRRDHLPAQPGWRCRRHHGGAGVTVMTIADDKSRHLGRHRLRPELLAGMIETRDAPARIVHPDPVRIGQRRQARTDIRAEVSREVFIERTLDGDQPPARPRKGRRDGRLGIRPQLARRLRRLSPQFLAARRIEADQLAVVRRHEQPVAHDDRLGVIRRQLRLPPHVDALLDVPRQGRTGVRIAVDGSVGQGRGFRVGRLRPGRRGSTAQPHGEGAIGALAILMHPRSRVTAVAIVRRAGRHANRDPVLAGLHIHRHTCQLPGRLLLGRLPDQRVVDPHASVPFHPRRQPDPLGALGADRRRRVPGRPQPVRPIEIQLAPLATNAMPKRVSQLARQPQRLDGNRHRAVRRVRHATPRPLVLLRVEARGLFAGDGHDHLRQVRPGLERIRTRHEPVTIPLAHQLPVRVAARRHRRELRVGDRSQSHHRRLPMSRRVPGNPGQRLGRTDRPRAAFDVPAEPPVLPTVIRPLAHFRQRVADRQRILPQRPVHRRHLLIEFHRVGRSRPLHLRRRHWRHAHQHRPSPFPVNPIRLIRPDKRAVHRPRDRPGVGTLRRGVRHRAGQLAGVGVGQCPAHLEGAPVLADPDHEFRRESLGLGRPAVQREDRMRGVVLRVVRGEVAHVAAPHLPVLDPGEHLALQFRREELRLHQPPAPLPGGKREALLIRLQRRARPDPPVRPVARLRQPMEVVIVAPLRQMRAGEFTREMHVVPEIPARGRELEPAGHSVLACNQPRSVGPAQMELFTKFRRDHPEFRSDPLAAPAMERQPRVLPARRELHPAAVDPVHALAGVVVELRCRRQRRPHQVVPIRHQGLVEVQHHVQRRFLGRIGRDALVEQFRQRRAALGQRTNGVSIRSLGHGADGRTGFTGHRGVQ